MNMLQVQLQTLEEEFREAVKHTSRFVPRDYHFPQADNVIKVAVGMRRSGKTCFLFQTIRELLANGIEMDQILYINFEDDRILPLDQKSMGQTIDAWYALYPKNHNRRCYLFFDEVQNVDGWPLVLRRILDTKNIQLFVTGSSAKMLSKEIATSLRGRSLAVEILPYSYSEYLSAHQLELPSRPLGKKALDHQRSYLLDYFRMGGFPGVQSMSPSEHLESLQNYVETVIFRDIVERHQVSNVALLKYFIHFLLKSISAPFSVNKFFNDVKSQGYKIGKDTLYTYLGYVEDAYLVFSVPIFSESLRRTQTTSKKIYGIDNGLIAANTFNLSANTGRFLENQVYLDLRRQGKKIFYYQTADGYEVDFITQDLQGKHEMIQVVWDASDPATLEREERALRQAEKELGFKGRLMNWESYIHEAMPLDT
jgi:predicted AAA+ superfamily ATPase